jgi:hypothetical protein
VADFDDLRRQLRDARAVAAAIDRALAATRQRLKRIDTRQAGLARVSRPNDDDDRHREARERLARDKAAAEAELRRLRGRRDEAIRGEAGLRLDFGVFTDPRKGIERLDDRTPILLMPVRLETRFTTVDVPGAAAPAPQLWVRIYPDDCWIDTFNPAITENEARNTRDYWANVWQSGDVEAQEREAWRALVGSHGSGRAAYLVQQDPPVNAAEKPAKAQPDDLVLVIVTDTAAALPAAEAAAAATFWRAAWLADGDAATIGTAQAALEAAVTPARADTILTRYQPVNFAATPAIGRTRASIAVSVAFLVFQAPLPGAIGDDTGAVDTTEHAWADAPKLTLLPDRFVFLGFSGSDPPVVVAGGPVPDTLFAGPDPSAEADDQIRHDDDGRLVVPDRLQWLSDFARAEKEGMALRVPLTAAQAQRGFDRVLVVGLRLNADVASAQREIETLLQHHAWSRSGLSLVPQGTPTNNTEAASAGHDRADDADASFDDRATPAFTPSADPFDKRDGQWLAEYLGLDPAFFQHVHHAGMTDQLAGRAMNTALWPATLGYWLTTMLAPAVTAAGIEQTRRFFTRYVLGSGGVPAIRIGSQPYGILPATALSRAQWMQQRDVAGSGPDRDLLPFLARLHPLLATVDADWRTAIPSSAIAHVRRDDDADPHATLLDILGLHPGSVEWAHRNGESIDSLFNRLNLIGVGGAIRGITASDQRARAQAALARLGYSGTTAPKILDAVFSGSDLKLTGGVVDDKPLSERDPLRVATTAGANYLAWLITAAGTSLDALYRQDGFLDDKPPAALLYLMLRHALQLGYHDVSVVLHEAAGLFSAAQSVAARSESPFLHVREAAAVSESRYQPLYAVAPAVTGHATQTVGAFIASRLGSPTFAFHLRDQLAALERLKGLPTARLERAFADHVDTCAYRLDAWQQGIVTYQLALMRQLPGQDGQGRQGLHLGAYGWVEDLRPEGKRLTPVTLTDPDLLETFGADEPALVRDPTSQGYVHAPSLNHAIAAAVLRNGFISNASEQNRQTLAVNLTSERVRTALALLEGIRGGQSLGDLLGYQFERGLHDRHAVAEVDAFVFALRRVFPLRGGRLASTKPPEGTPIEAIEARNVIDGLAFAEHLKATQSLAYPFGKTGLPTATGPQARAIEAEARRLLDAHDAVADLALSEGVYQAVLGNYERVASTYDAYARGNFPPEPDVIRTPLNGIGLTSRVALHLDAAASATVSPIAGLPMTPRAQAEPSLNAWLASQLPPLATIGCVVAFREAATGDPSAQAEITLDQLGLQPADLVLLLGDDRTQALADFDDRVIRVAVTTVGPRPDVPVTIAYLRTQAAPTSVFAALPLFRALRRIVTRARPLRPTDLALTREAAVAQDVAPTVDTARLTLVQTALGTLKGDLAAFAAQLQGPLSDLATRRPEILTDVDTYVDTAAALLARAATFGVPQSGWAFAYDFRQRAFVALLQQAAAIADRWTARLAEFDALIADRDALPVAASDAEHVRILAQAERVISTVPISPVPATPALFRTALLTSVRPAFVARRQAFADVAQTTRTGVAALRTDLLALLPIGDVDVTPVSLAPQEDAMVRFAEDTLRVITTVHGHVDRRLLDAAARLQDAADAALALDAVAALEQTAQALLGEDFRVVPTFTLDAARASEFANAVAIAQSPAPFAHLTTPADADAPALDFPVDTWLHGVARVREQMQAWEQVVLLADASGRPEPALTALQLPVIPGDAWVGLQLAPGQTLDTERLLYTAHFAVAFAPAAPLCGLLVDEWTETIPGGDVDTGLTFHHDRPNTEAPQTMLLVTPSRFTGAWQWNDLVDALHDTFELAKRRAIEPRHVDTTAYAPLLPATVMASQARQLTIAANLAFNNRVVLASHQP